MIIQFLWFAKDDMPWVSHRSISVLPRAKITFLRQGRHFEEGFIKENRYVCLNYLKEKLSVPSELH